VVPFSFASFLLGRQKKMKEDLLKEGHVILFFLLIEALFFRQSKTF